MSLLRSRSDERRGGALVMGILNRTPDSFSDGGAFLDEPAARAHAQRMLAEGADVIDVGAESTRPGAPAIDASEQLARIGAVVRELSGAGALVSIDTTLPEVAERALADGARVVNSVSLEPAAELARLCARHDAALVLMHSRGAMSAMAGFSVYADDAYGDVVADVSRELLRAAELAIAAGLPREEVWLDPGLGFAKNAAQSLQLCARLHEICSLGHPVLVGPSRKSFLVGGTGSAGATAVPPQDRLGATIAATLACVARGARAVRVHDVAEVRQALGFAQRLGDPATGAPVGARATGAPVGAHTAGAPVDARSSVPASERREPQSDSLRPRGDARAGAGMGGGRG
jgi:dihydropteroate synthase